MKTGFLVVARLKSTRLPRKVLLEVKGRSFLTHLVDRVKSTRRIDQIVLCTSTHEQDDSLEELAKVEGIACFRGDEEDVLMRLHQAVVAHNLNYMVTITGDCPLVEPEYIDRLVDDFSVTGADYTTVYDLPHGSYSWGLKPSALARAIELKNDSNTEVWERYFTDTDCFQIHRLSVDSRHCRPGLRMTLDYPEDLVFFKRLFDALYEPGRILELDEILGYLDAHPEVEQINAHCEELYSRRRKQQNVISLKPRYAVERAAIIGAGSIGQRHIRNLRKIGIQSIAALRTRRGHFRDLNPDLEVRETTDFSALMASKPDIAIVSNPTSEHLKTAARLLPQVRGVMIEKPLSDSLHGVKEFLRQVRRHRAVTFIAYNFQFHEIFRTVGDLIKSERLGRPLNLQAVFGHWLPDWHPYEDYRYLYAARKELGGGVALTLIHEVEFALSLFGEAKSVTAAFSSSDALETDVDACADIMIRHAEGPVSQLHLDYLQQPWHREGQICCEKGSVRYDFSNQSVTCRSAGESEWVEIWRDPDHDSNRCYIDMLRDFVDCVKEGRIRHDYDAWKGTGSLAVVECGRRAAAEGRWIELPEWAQERSAS